MGGIGRWCGLAVVWWDVNVSQLAAGTRDFTLSHVRTSWARFYRCLHQKIPKSPLTTAIQIARNLSRHNYPITTQISRSPTVKRHNHQKLPPTKTVSLVESTSFLLSSPTEPMQTQKRGSPRSRRVRRKVGDKNDSALTRDEQVRWGRNFSAEDFVMLFERVVWGRELFGG